MCQDCSQHKGKLSLTILKRFRILRLFRRYTFVLGNDIMVRLLGLLLVLLFCGTYIHSAGLQYIEQLRDDKKYRAPQPVTTYHIKSRRRDISRSVLALETRLTKPSTTGVAKAECDSSPGFLSIRADKRWKLKLAAKYDELVSSLQHGFGLDDDQALYDVQAVPRRPSGHENQTLASFFLPIISQMEYRILIGSFYTMAEALVEANVTFFLYGGSQLGAFRHHGLVPWDDDVDVMFNVSDKGKIKQILSNIPYYTLFAPEDRQWKFFETSLANVLHSKYTWPFIDIFFFEENATHVWDNLPMFKSVFCFLKEDVFPVVYRPFENGLAPVPRRSESVLRQSYDIDMCHTNFYWHKYESWAPKDRDKQADCAHLFDSLPFVFRQRLSHSCLEETLRRGNRTLSRFVLNG